MSSKKVSGSKKIVIDPKERIDPPLTADGIIIN